MACFGYWGNDTRARAKMSIDVIRGNPKKAKYAIFYEVESDPVYFANTKEKALAIVKKLKARKDVRNIVVFKLVKM